MRKNLLPTLALLIAAGFSQPLRAQSLDLAFAAVSAYAPGQVTGTLEQPDGKRVIKGNYSRLNGSAASGMSRLNANGTLDAAFQQNVGGPAAPQRMQLLANGQFLLSYFGSTIFRAGGLSRQALLRLNADGTGDASFDAGTGPAYSGPGLATPNIHYFCPLPNGQTVAVGHWDSFNGTTGSSCIVRLTASGAVDPTFNSGGTGINANSEDLESIVALPNGKFMVGGYFSSYNGTARNGIARINADGSLDASFNAGLYQYTAVNNILVQPDGKLLISGSGGSFSPGSPAFYRLLPNGGPDASFTPPMSSSNLYTINGNDMQLQPDGKVVYYSTDTSNGTSGVAATQIGRLNANGTPDATFQPGIGVINLGLTTLTQYITLLSNGNILVGGSFTNFSGVLDRPLIELTSTGAMAAAPPPLVQTGAIVTAVARQADGRLVAAGSFSEINGQPVRRLARFNANGTLDPSFPTNVGIDNRPTDLVIQPDGRILVTGLGFCRRYLATGAPDNTWGTLASGNSNMYLLLQPDGRVLVGNQGALYYNGTYLPQGFMRLMADGSQDNSFVTNGTGPGQFAGFTGFALQPNGKVLVACRFTPNGTAAPISTIVRLEATGTVDAGFTGGEVAPASTAFTSLAVQNDGKILLGGLFTSYGGTARANLARLNADGTLDGSFAPPALTGQVLKLLLQPNNRILVGGFFTGTGLPKHLARLLSTGQADASFGPSAVPNSTVRALLVQPDGAIVAAGSFGDVDGVATGPIARITATNVLHVQAPQAVADRTAAWPVPAHAILTVAPDASATPQALDLLDVLGRVVRHQNLSSTAPTNLAIENLPAGMYLLRVTYAEGTVTRRVQVQ